MKIIVNDANILIDLANIDLLDKLTKLNVELHTNDFIINEIIKPEQKEMVNAIIKANRLIVGKTEASEYAEILKRQTKNLSFEDCSIWHYTNKVGGILLTGDNNLRKTVKAEGTEVRGILYLFDQLVQNKIISKEEAVEKLRALFKLNSRLPKSEIEKRLSSWRK